jgi:hypothetical protein
MNLSFTSRNPDLSGQKAGNEPERWKQNEGEYPMRDG